ncbi:CRISPR-associated ring nuclease Csm6 [Leucothrix arctica]|uniref:TIGR02584 family CRISPR-associated protein n=1 Tax=Leucothrix arctica TaxID=1481894 RepID=A0A317CM79_9GAMM|nr:CRISPR-associated ring nuclease Csm6 [Leucothrix arctica]PWQ99331.1 TIGR02584 family CRISPR-associated protein [Leucothrix arctica]
MTDHKPRNHPLPERRILLAVASHSPQIITETIYALTQQTEPAFMPTEIHVITTLLGQSYIHQVFGEEGKQGWLHRLCDDYSLPCPAQSKLHIHVISDADGQPLDDVRTRADNTDAADFITQTVQQLTADLDSKMVVSLSGGRRTMTFYVGYALSLYGRPQDRLTHVLVEDEYFFNSDFFYPPPTETWVVREDNTGFDASKVEVTLADIPFVRLREGLPSRLLSGQTSFSDTVDAAQAELLPAKVVFNALTVQLFCGETQVSMNAVELSFYVMMLRRCALDLEPVRWTDTGLGDDFLDVYQSLNGLNGGYDRAKKTLINGMTKEYFEQRKSRVNRQLREALGKRLSTHYIIDSHGKRPNTRFGLTLSASVITLA